MFIKDIMTRNVVCADPDENIFSIAKKMRDEKIGVVPVCNGEKLFGVVTDRDIVTRVIAQGNDPTKVTARKFMTTKPVVCRETETVEDAVHLMENKHIRRLPVVDAKDHLVGMLTLDDVASHTPQFLSREAFQALSFAKKTPLERTTRV